MTIRATLAIAMITATAAAGGGGRNQVELIK